VKKQAIRPQSMLDAQCAIIEGAVLADDSLWREPVWRYEFTRLVIYNPLLASYVLPAVIESRRGH
jgi:hypothetical protein